MEQLMYENPVAYWGIGYGLIACLWLVQAVASYGWKKLPAVMWIACLLWPLTVAAMLILLLCLGLHSAYKWWRKPWTK